MDTIDRIRQLAKEKGIKTTFISAQLRLSSSYFADVKSGKTKISDERLSKIAEILGTTPEYLKGETDQKEKPLVNGDEELNEYLEELKNRSEMRMLFSLAKGATKKDVEAAVKIIEALRSQGDGDE